MLCAKTSVQNSSLTGVQNTKGRSIVKCMAFAGASTLCANLTSVQIIEVCKLTGLTVRLPDVGSKGFSSKGFSSTLH